MNTYSTLISTGTLRKWLDSPLVNGPPLVIVDCRFDLTEPERGQSEYHSGHVPGAFYAHLDRDLSSSRTPESGRHPLPQADAFRTLAGSWGVTPETQVVAYDHGAGAIAARLWWLVRWIGHRHVAVLDGGFKAWNEIGGSLSTEVPESCVDVPPAGCEGIHEPSVSTRDLANALYSVQLIDARDSRRFQGEVEPLDTVAGHVPGAINLPFTGNLDANGLFLDPESLRERFSSLLGWKDTLDEDVPVVNMCGSGVTACHNILAMEIAGYSGTKLYAGSWSEWIRNPSRPVAKEE